MTSILLAALLACAPARAAQTMEKDDFVHNQNWACAVQAFQTQMSVPALEPGRGWSQEASREAGERVARARKRLFLARQSLDLMQAGAAEVVGAADNECSGVWDAWDVLKSTAEAAVREEEEPLLSVYERSGWKVRWETVAISKLAAQVEEVDAQPGRFAQVCRPVPPDLDFYVPDAEGRPGLAKIEATARRVRSALQAQSEAFEALLPLAQGRRCGELVRAFDRLVAAERQAFFAFRQKAVADAFWDGLQWRKAAGPAR